MTQLESTPHQPRTRLAAPQRLPRRHHVMKQSQAMTIGHRGYVVHSAPRRSGSMKAPRVFRTGGPYALASRISPQTKAGLPRAMTYGTDVRLWKRGMGIRFSPRLEAIPRHPAVNESRSVHQFSGAAAAEGRGPDPRADHDRPRVMSCGQESEMPEPHAGEDRGGPTNGTKDPGPETDLAKKDGAKTEIVPVKPRSEPPTTSLPYKMPLESFRRARAAPIGSPNSYWSHTMYQSTEDDGTVKRVKVHYCTSKHTMDYVCKKYFLGEKILGFDMEWMAGATKESGPRQNVSLIQLASPGHIGLFHCAMFSKEDFVARTFRQIMGDADVRKVGVAIKADCTRLANYMGVDTRGILELSNMYKMVKYIKEGRLELINKYLVNLETQVQDCLGLPLFKGQSVRSSDWTRFLTSQQILYSASDAYAGLQLYHVLDEARQKLKPCPPLPHHAELGLPLPIPVAKVASSEVQDGQSLAEGSTEATAAKDAATDVQDADDVAQKFQDRRITAADAKMKEYRASKRGPVSVGPAALRAYYVWHANEDLNPEAIAKLLREPPLQTNTVVTYILNAVTEEELPYDRTRVRDELLCALNPTAMKAAKYQSLVQSCQAAAASTPA